MVRRTLARLDADDIDARIGAWMRARTRLIGGRQVIPLDGKSLRGADDGTRMPHLLAALTHAEGVVVAQQAVRDKGSEIHAACPARAGKRFRHSIISLFRFRVRVML